MVAREEVGSVVRVAAFAVWETAVGEAEKEGEAWERVAAKGARAVVEMGLEALLSPGAAQGRAVFAALAAPSNKPAVATLLSCPPLQIGR